MQAARVNEVARGAPIQPHDIARPEANTFMLQLYNKYYTAYSYYGTFYFIPYLRRARLVMR